MDVKVLILFTILAPAVMVQRVSDAAWANAALVLSLKTWKTHSRLVWHFMTSLWQVYGAQNTPGSVTKCRKVSQSVAKCKHTLWHFMTGIPCPKPPFGTPRHVQDWGHRRQHPKSLGPVFSLWCPAEIDAALGKEPFSLFRKCTHNWK